MCKKGLDYYRKMFLKLMNIYVYILNILGITNKMMQSSVAL